MSVFIERKTCEVCGSSDYRILYDLSYADPRLVDSISGYYSHRVPMADLAEGHYQLARCNDCGFIWQTMILSDAYMFKLYEEWISPEESRSSFSGGHLSAYRGNARNVAKLASYFPGHRPHELSVLDFGMGWGEWVLMAKAHGLNVAGLELSQSRIEHAANHALPTINKLEAAHQFHIIYSNQVFEHLANPYETLLDLVQHLRPGGILCLSVPNADGIERIVQREGWYPSRDTVAVQALEHINAFNYQTLVRLGQRAGLHLTQESAWRLRLVNWSPVPSTRLPKLRGLSLYFRQP